MRLCPQITCLPVICICFAFCFNEPWKSIDTSQHLLNRTRSSPLVSTFKLRWDTWMRKQRVLVLPFAVFRSNLEPVEEGGYKLTTGLRSDTDNNKRPLVGHPSDEAIWKENRQRCYSPMVGANWQNDSVPRGDRACNCLLSRATQGLFLCSLKRY